jgi:uncharacterized protein (TIGR03437 family)
MRANQRARFIAILGLLLGFCLSGVAQSGGAITANPSTLNLDNTSGPVVTALVTLTTSGTAPIPFTVPLGNVSWLSASPLSGTVVPGTPTTLTITANASALGAGSSYDVYVPIVYGTYTQQTTPTQILVNFNVEVVTGLSPVPQSASWTYAPGGAPPTPQPVRLVTSSATFTAVVGSNSPWLELGLTNPPVNFVPQQQLLGYPTSGGFTLVASNLTTLTPGTIYYGIVTVTDPNGDTATLTVSLAVLGQGSAFTVSPTNLNLTTSGSSVFATIALSSPNPAGFTATATSTSPTGGTWLSVTPSSGVTPQNLTVTANPAGLAAGSYSGVITAISGALSATVQVSFVVSTGAAGGGNVVSSQTALTATYQVGGTVPPVQTMTISNQAANTAPIPFTVSAVVSGGTSTWLSVAVQGGGTQGTTPNTVLVSFSPQGLAAGTYSGTVYITPQGGNVLGIQVTLTVQAESTVTASPLQLSFNYQVGGTVPANQTVQVTGNAASLPFSVVTSTSTGGNWLSAGVTNGVTPATLNVSAIPGNLGAGLYQGTIVITGTGIATGTTTVSVSLTVAVGLPTITVVQNAATSLLAPVSPGEIVAIKGTTLGPATPAYETLTPAGTVSTNIGNVRVLFNGTYAPLTYVSATQINCVVPYEFAAVASGAYVQVIYQGQSSNTYPLVQASTAPGIFTANSTGTGPGAILNGDNTYNSSSNPAPKGSTVQIFMTGEGLISPQSATGSVTCAAGCATVSQIPKPVLPVAALINGQPATITFFGEAPGDVSGVLQVDVTIPPNTPSGAAPLVISVGTNSSQALVTVAVQ